MCTIYLMQLQKQSCTTDIYIYTHIYVSLIEPEKKNQKRKLGSNETIKSGIKTETKLGTCTKTMIFQWCL